MSTTKRMRAVISVITAALITFTLSACAGGYGSNSNPKTSDYLYGQFTKDGYLDPYETGVGDVGITLESMIQLSAVGYDKTKFTKSISWLTKNEKRASGRGRKPLCRELGWQVAVSYPHPTTLCQSFYSPMSSFHSSGQSRTKSCIN